MRLRVLDLIGARIGGDHAFEAIAEENGRRNLRQMISEDCGFDCVTACWRIL
jgi:hypothetical protein